MFPGAPIGQPPGINFGSFFKGDPTLGLLANSLLQPLVGAVIGPNYVPAQAMPMTSFFSQYQTADFLRRQQAAGRVGAEIDAGAYYRMLRGASAMAGLTFDAEQQQRVAQMSQGIAQVAPFLSMVAPDLFDALHGTRGSAYLMSRQIAMGSRYMADPVTGGRGLTEKSLETMTRTVYDELYGPGADVRQMRGISAGQAGLMFDELTRRGVMAGTGGRDIAVRDMATELGKTVDELDKLPDIDAKLRNFESQKVVKQLKSMSAAVAAMRDVFGDNGMADAPISALVEGLNALTQGGLSSLDPQQITKRIRLLQDVTQSTGTTLEQAMRVTAYAAQRGAALGLDPDMALSAAMGGFNYADAYARNFGGARFPRKMSKEQVVLAATQLEQNAAASPFAVELATTLRLADELQAIDMTQDTEASRLVKALKTPGATTFIGKSGETRRIADLRTQSGPGSISELLRQSGVDEGTIVSAMAQRQAALDVVRDNRGIVENAVLAQSRQDTVERFTGPFQQRIKYEMDADRLKGISRDVMATAVQDTLTDLASSGLTDEEVTKVGKRDFSPIAGRIEQNLKSRGVELTPEQRKDVSRYAAMAWGDVSQAMAANPSSAGFINPLNALTLRSERTIKTAQELQRESEARSALREATSPLNRSSGMRQFIDKIQTATASTSFEELLAAAFGYVDKNEAMKAIGPEAKKILTEVKELSQVDPRTLRRKIEKGEMSDEEKARIEKIYGPIKDITSMSDSDIRVRAANAAETLIKTNLSVLKKELDVLDQHAANVVMDKTAGWWGTDTWNPLRQLASTEKAESGRTFGDEYTASLGRMEGDLVPVTEAPKTEDEVKGLRAAKDAAIVRRDKAKEELLRIAKGKSTTVSELLQNIDPEEADRQTGKAVYTKYSEAMREKQKLTKDLTEARTRQAPKEELDRIQQKIDEQQVTIDKSAVELEKVRERAGVSLTRLLSDKNESTLPAEEQAKIKSLYREGSEADKQIRSTSVALKGKEKAAGGAPPDGGASMRELRDPGTAPSGINRPATGGYGAMGGGLVIADQATKTAAGDQAKTPVVQAVLGDDIEIKGTLDISTGAIKLRPVGQSGVSNV
jgi:hypothetical protein